MRKIAVDLCGSDLGPMEILTGCIKALDDISDLQIIAFGDKKLKETIDSKYLNRIDILHCENEVTCLDNPGVVIFTKKNSSMIKGLKYLKENDDVSTFISAGSTASLITASYIIHKKSSLIKPVLAPILPAINGNGVIFLDAGANIECTSTDLLEFAKLGIDYCKEKFKKETVNIGFLSNGTEESKGTKAIRDAISLIKDLENINLKGQIEARDILSGEFDVIVTDGFSGNIALKSYEGMAKTIFKMLKNEISSSGIRSKIGALLLKPSLKKIANKLDYNKQTGGALILGLNKKVVKAHGSSKSEAIRIAIREFIYE